MKILPRSFGKSRKKNHTAILLKNALIESEYNVYLHELHKKWFIIINFEKK